MTPLTKQVRLNSSAVPLDRVVAVARSQRAEYGSLTEPIEAPEFYRGQISTVAQQAVRNLFGTWGLDPEHARSSSWNPLGAFIPAGSRVVIKPNWVRHWNQSGAGLECLITHTSVIEAVLEYVALALPSRVTIGDAPLQSCDFQKLRADCRLDDLVRRFQDRGLSVELRDFRRTVLHGDTLGAHRSEQISELGNYVIFDLLDRSLLEPITKNGNFRVTVYNPDFLSRTHGPGRHQYLIARECMDADVLINLPKLKCHKKVGITGALKNVVGINGNKEYLPHHRKGGLKTGGDCYAGSSWLKRHAEDLLDTANRESSRLSQRLFASAADIALRISTRAGTDDNLDGSWYGNDTVWRTCLDLQRILRYGRSDGTLSQTPEREVITITDAIIGGEGEGPLSPTPVPAGFVTGAANPAAADWVHARLMGLNPRHIPLVREAFSDYPFPVARFSPAEIQIAMADRDFAIDEIYPFNARAFCPPRGWIDHCELRGQGDE